MSSATSRMMTGAVKGTGASLDVKVVGFRPRRVELVNVAAGGLVTGKWQKEMADASMVKQAAAGTTTLITTLGITPLSQGFTVGADTDMNVSGEQINWTAWE